MAKHLLLTGGAGFIGHHTVEHVLKNTDWNVTIVDRLTYAGNLNRLQDLDCWESEKKRVRFYFHDFRADLRTTSLVFVDTDYIIHMGAESHVDRSIKDPEPFVSSNVLGTLNMLQFAKAVGAKKFIQVSTDEVYGPSINGHLHTEGEPHRPGNPYSASKAGAEDLCRAFWNTYEVPVIITNTMNNFGERQDIEKFVPKTMRAIIQGRPVTIHVKKGPNGEILDTSSRCWLHARNHADALLFLLENGNPGEQYNVTGVLRDVREMAGMIAEYLDAPCTIVEEDFHSFRKGHDMHYGLDGSKLAALGWTPKYGLEESLRRTVQWTKENPWWLGV